jgi:hypothetical protein
LGEEVAAMIAATTVDTPRLDPQTQQVLAG